MIFSGKYKWTLLGWIVISLSCGQSEPQSGYPVLAESAEQDSILSWVADPRESDLRFYYKNDKGERIGNFESLKKMLAEDEERLIFATNGGMFQKDFSPQGLYIENGRVIQATDTQQTAYGNFYLQPNGIFYLRNNGSAAIVTTDHFLRTSDIRYATQSGPMLLINGDYHPAIREGSTNLHIRNGVGILPDGRVIFAMSKSKINFYDLATFFKKVGCKNALYLDGFVSRTYLPEKGFEDAGGEFGVMIGEVGN